MCDGCPIYPRDQQPNTPHTRHDDSSFLSLSCTEPTAHSRHWTQELAGKGKSSKFVMAKASLHKHLEAYDLHGWRPNRTLSSEDNLMDLVMLVTRSSKCRQGSMACILVSSIPEEPWSEEALCGSILSVATNQAIFTAQNSDVHAEVVAIGRACRTGTKTEGSTAFITMPPCRRCFAALTVAGVKKIVTRIQCPSPIVEGAKKNNIELSVLGKIQEQTARINTLVYGNPNGKRQNPREENGVNKKSKTAIEKEEKAV